MLNILNLILYFNLINMSFNFIKYFYILYIFDIFKSILVNIYWVDIIYITIFSKCYNRYIISKYHSLINFFIFMLILYNFFTKYNIFILNLYYLKKVNLFMINNYFLKLHCIFLKTDKILIKKNLYKYASLYTYFLFGDLINFIYIFNTYFYKNLYINVYINFYINLYINILIKYIKT